MEQRLDTSLSTQLNQSLRTSPRMIQSMEVLQMPLPALQERIDQELESNIALEVDETQMAAGDEGESVESDVPADGAEEFQRLDSMEQTYAEAYDNTLGSRSINRSTGDGDRKLEAMANISARGDSLQDEMLHQWTFADVGPQVAHAGRLLIEFLSPDGLLEVGLDQVLEQSPRARDEGVTIESLEEALVLLQQLAEPSGIGARSLRECLLLQVHSRMELDESSRDAWARVGMLIESHLDDLVQNRLPDIARATGLSMDDVRDSMRLMHRLSLAPGRDLAPLDVPPVIPDVLVEYDDATDAYAATLLEGPIPPLRVSPRYEKMAKDRSLDAEARSFLERNVESARWMIDALRQRGATLLRVVRVVLDRQRAFFDEGPRHLRPLPMTEVADTLGVHVATVSRTVADKWMQTPRGVVPLRRFFSGGTSTSTGEAMSWAAVREVLREIIEREDTAKPHSDEALAAALRERGIDIARRTVVKYRQKMGIPPARLRRTF
ncbi:MAG: RNA polymerase factor sigma-54 [Phycisphaerales bacterium]|nr:RNA polymerase factor sigma-54 [Phycisphaerales bacterium]